jgi:hypothetical protein
MEYPGLIVHITLHTSNLDVVSRPTRVRTRVKVP